jgi:hypothetical protein
MSNASPRDAAIGYDYFWRQRGKISRDDLNEYLTASHRSPISARTFAHYQHLLSHGVRHYVPINRFDVLSALGKLDAVTDRNSYAREAVDIEAQVSRDGNRWFEAQVIDRSQVILGLLIRHQFPIPSGSLLLVRLQGYRDIPTVVVWREHGEDFTRIDAHAIQFIASYRDERGEAYNRGFGRLVIERDAEGKIPWVNFYGVLSTANVLIEATTQLLYTLGDACDADLRVAEPVVQYISFGSPGGAGIKLDIGLTDLLQLLFDKVQFWKSDRRIRAAEAERKTLENRQLQAQIEIEQERSSIGTAILMEDLKQKHLENAARGLHVLGLANNLSIQASNSELVDTLAEEIKIRLPDILGISVPAEKLSELFSPGTPERGLLSDHLLPAAAELSGGDDRTFTVKAETDSGDNK